ncbi:MAG: zinc-domain-containing protein [Nitrososphaeraceae archaeon]|nr:zinc-domain-containing protein [Nitrososphaeraceae archaeon]
MLEAKCHKCDNKALVDDEMQMVSCPNCNSEIPYEKYLEIMKDRAINMGFDFSVDLNKNPF